MTILHNLWLRLGPVTALPSGPELARAGLGAGLGLALAGLLVMVADRFAPGWLFLFAPLGASAVLIFAVPSSPLAQPWNCVVGNGVSAVFTWLLLLSLPELPQTGQAALAVAGAIMVMLLCRALHPPGGAVALLTVLASAQMLPLGWHLPVAMALLSAVLVLAGLLYHRACGRPYLLHHHHAPSSAHAGESSGLGSGGSRLALSNEELQQLLKRYGQSYNLGPEDLGELLVAAEELAIKRRLSSISCGEVMSSQLLTIQPETPLEQVADLFHAHLVKSLPVVDGLGHLVGRVVRPDLFDWLWEGHRQSVWRRMMRLPGRQPRLAQSLMREPEMCVQESTPLGDLLHELASHQVQFIAVLRGRELVGVITRSDVLRTLLALQ